MMLRRLVALIVFCTSVSIAQKCIPKTLSRCTCVGSVAEKYVVNCQNAGLTDIPKNIPTYTTHLILDRNNVSTLQNNSFSGGLPALVMLSMRNNRLKKIGGGAFNNMKSLGILDLYSNSLEQNDSLPSTVFLPISSTLKLLDIRRNLMNENTSLIDYPIAVGSLKALTVLKMDCLRSKPLPTEYGNLKDLERLIFGGGRTDVVRLAEAMFDAVSNINITEINLVNIRLGDVNLVTLGKVKSLQILNLAHNPSLGQGLINIVKGLIGTAVQTLILNNTNMGDHATDIIKQMGNLDIKQLIMDKNEIYDIDPILTKYVRNVTILSFGDNYMYERSDLIWDIYHLPRLEGLNISWQQRESSSFPEQHNFNMDIGMKRFKKSTKRKHYGIHICQTDMACPVKIPPYLLWLDMSHYGLHFTDMPELVVLSNSTLKYVNVAYSGVQFLRKPVFCTIGPFHTTVQIETFDFRYNTIQCINESMFDFEITHCDWKSLKNLYFGSNKIGDVDGNICNKDKSNILGFLRPLKGLQTLDLSMNNIGGNMKYHDLKGLDEMEILDLSSNALKTWSLDIENMTKLDMINISYNNLPCLSIPSIKTLDRLQKKRKKPGSIRIDLTGNLLSCDCQCIEFFQWLKKTKVNVVDYRQYRCAFPDGKIWQLNRLDTIVAKLEAECYATLWLDLYIGLAILIYCLIFALTMMYRMRHEIKYMWIKMKMNRDKLERLFSTRRSRFKFDAFVSCEHNDARLFVHRHLLPKLETKNKGLTAAWLKQKKGKADLGGHVAEAKDTPEPPDMSFCLAQRDFIVGESIIKNIVRTMRASRKVILIVSNYSLSSRWCEEEMRIAHQESLDRGKNIIICVFMPGVEQDKLPSTIRMITKFVTCLRWPQEQGAQNVFWLMLRKAIMDGTQDEDIVDY